MHFPKQNVYLRTLPKHLNQKGSSHTKSKNVSSKTILTTEYFFKLARKVISIYRIKVIGIMLEGGTTYRT